jgi:hypothetical protein
LEAFNMRTRILAGALSASALFVAASGPEARACGGCFNRPLAPTETGSVVTDHQMIFVTSPQQTTLYDMIKYTGSPSSFAWVLPIHGTVHIGLSSYTLFAALDQVTRPNILPPPYPTCPVPADCNFCGGGASGNASGGTNAAAGAPVAILSQETVGPYDTVQLQSTDPNALTAWLNANNYAIPTDIQPLIAKYVSEGFDFLALRLSPGQGVQSMRPISVSAAGAGVSLPLRMVAAGTGATVGITLWVAAAGRYEPQNFGSFVIQPSELVWDWSNNSSNYSMLQQAMEGALGNAAWQTEASLDVTPYTVETLVLNGTGGRFVSSGGGPAIDAAAEGYTSSGDGGDASTADQQRQADLDTLFPGGVSTVRLTRMRADLSHAALANDLTLQASSDQSTVSNVYQIDKAINAPTCPNPPVCPCGTGGLGSFGGSTGAMGPGGSGVVGVGGGTPIGNGGTPSSSGGPASGGASTKSSGCSASASEVDGTTGLVFAGLVGAAVTGSRLRRRRRS